MATAVVRPVWAGRVVWRADATAIGSQRYVVAAIIMVDDRDGADALRKAGAVRHSENIRLAAVLERVRHAESAHVVHID